MTQRIYLDHNASAPPRPEAVAAAAEAMREGGNPSSIHAEGRQARRRLEAARGEVARLVGVAPTQVLFTGGATEANFTALTPDLVRDGRPLRLGRLLVSAVEHPSVSRGGRFPPEAVGEIPVDGNGVVRLDRLAAMLAEGDPPGGGVPMVAVQVVNGETGVIQPIAEVARLVRAAGGVLVSDAAQAAGRIRLNDPALDADFLTLSAHKIGGIQGAGALIARDPSLWPAPLLTGGGQEANRRAGTENGPAVAAFGAAARAAGHDLARSAEIAALRDWLVDALRSISKDVTIFGAAAERVANTAYVGLPGVAAETAVIAFDLAGVAVSSGSACSSGKVAPSRVLKAMGVSGDLLRGGLRISLGWNTSREEVERFASIWRDVTARLRSRSGRAA